MSNEDNIIEGEIVDNLPAVIPRETYRSGEAIKERDWPQGPTPDRRCRAHKKTGEQCKNAALQGATVCRFHGGAARHVKAAARARLDNAADLMARKLLGIALAGESEAVRLTAIRDALDRVGITKPTEIVVGLGESKPWEEVYDGIAGVSREESRAARGYIPEAEPGRETSSYEAGSQGGESPMPPASAFTAEPPAPNVPAEEPAPRDFDPGRHAQRPVHITGDLALRVAADLARQQRAIER